MPPLRYESPFLKTEISLVNKSKKINTLLMNTARDDPNSASYKSLVADHRDHVKVRKTPPVPRALSRARSQIILGKEQSINLSTSIIHDDFYTSCRNLAKERFPHLKIDAKDIEIETTVFEVGEKKRDADMALDPSATVSTRATVFKDASTGAKQVRARPSTARAVLSSTPTKPQTPSAALTRNRPYSASNITLRSHLLAKARA
jgi:hypothetical protein